MKLALITDKNKTDEITLEEAAKAGAGDMGQWLNSTEAGRILSVNDSRVRQYVADGRLTSHSPEAGQRDHYFKRADVEALAATDRERTGRPDEGKGTSRKKKKTEVKESAEAPAAEEKSYEVIDGQTGKKVGGPYKTRSRATTYADKKDNEYGAYRYKVRLVGSKD